MFFIDSVKIISKLHFLNFNAICAILPHKDTDERYRHFCVYIVILCSRNQLGFPEPPQHGKAALLDSAEIWLLSVPLDMAAYSSCSTSHRIITASIVSTCTSLMRTWKDFKKRLLTCTLCML